MINRMLPLGLALLLVVSALSLIATVTLAITVAR
jgi:hypothetical protein